MKRREMVHHPAHYGGADNPYEAIKVIEAWKLGFCLGNTVKYISRHGLKGTALQDLKKAAWYLNREIQNMEAAREQVDQKGARNLGATRGRAARNHRVRQRMLQVAGVQQGHRSPARSGHATPAKGSRASR